MNAYYEKSKKIDFDAIVSLNDDMAFACIDFLRRKNLRVPEDVIVTGFDDVARASITTPSLTTVNQDIEGQGYAAAETVYEMINKKNVPISKTINSKAVFRCSCGCFSKIKNFGTECDEDGNIIQLDSNNTNKIAIEASRISSQFIQMIHLYSDMQSDGSLDVFRRQINGELSSIEITAAAICFFNPPVSADSFEFFSLPKEAIVLSAFDISTGFQFDSDKKPIVFNPQNEIIPDGLFKTLDGMYVVSLFRASVQYGYLIFRPGSFDMIVYNMISSMFSTALAFAYNISCVENEKKQLEKEYTIASQISITDEMTGLLNRRGFISLSQKTLEVAQATSQTGMILYGDMDGLKKINDTYGHNAGDIAIKAESEILKKQFRSVDIIGRMGGDEFAITASGMTDEKYKKIRKQIIDDCKEWNKTSGEKFQFSISIGAATFSSETKNYNIKNLLDIADAQLYEEKKSKKTLRKE